GPEGAGEFPPASTEQARELADASVRDCDGRPVVTDRHGDPGGGVALPPRERLSTDGAKERECLDVDADELDLRQPAGSDEPVDELAVGHCEQHTTRPVAVVEHVVV